LLLRARADVQFAGASDKATTSVWLLLDWPSAQCDSTRYQPCGSNGGIAAVGDAQGDSHNTGADRSPDQICGTATCGKDLAGPGRTAIGHDRVATMLDPGDPFEQTMQKGGVISGTRAGARGMFGVVGRETLTVPKARSAAGA